MFSKFNVDISRHEISIPVLSLLSMVEIYAPDGVSNIITVDFMNKTITNWSDKDETDYQFVDIHFISTLVKSDTTDYKYFDIESNRFVKTSYVKALESTTLIKVNNLVNAYDLSSNNAIQIDMSKGSPRFYQFGILTGRSIAICDRQELVLDSNSIDIEKYKQYIANLSIQDQSSPEEPIDTLVDYEHQFELLFDLMLDTKAVNKHYPFGLSDENIEIARKVFKQKLNAHFDSKTKELLKKFELMLPRESLVDILKKKADGLDLNSLSKPQGNKIDEEQLLKMGMNLLKLLGKK